MQILVVDDDEDVSELLVSSLRRAGHEARKAGDGDEGWHIWQNERQRLVVTDWLMPALDGPGLIARLRAASTQRYTYIILLTVKREKKDVVEGLRAGADDYLTKPFHTGELLARVDIGERILTLESQLSDTIAQLERQTKYDDLTGVLNRRRLFELAEQEFDHSRRYGRALTAVMLDIDHFKQVNDVHGHAVGDQVLRVVAERCRQNLRTVDILGRYGGEEFAAVMPETELSAAVPALVSARPGR
ncbi:MAG: diguanylate cyclase [Chloroflexi bacterium]|nr:diguanylate cyclase [Chloroflexota bacterium]